ncbi:nucleotidyltransferase domain-containing protein [Bacillus sp. T3]|uniref:nucleotidyltransferase domain-containing protein n=1 Tax=Bacillus sp. T3 TaxID=467262 RepID=UPI0029812DEF|nr:nucleotidyltransferase domain-containing protein [Bacillus sp. T3]
MKDTIVENLKKLEQQHDIKVIFAVESGSRSTGIPSQDSDYDVRFIYVHRLEWYLSIDEKRETLEVPISDHLDLNGWELRKSLRLLRKSNPHLFEWLHSGIQYAKVTTFLEKIKSLEQEAFSAKPALFHYLNMAKRNATDFFQSDIIKTKNYFYVLRPVLACLWIEKYRTFPPVELRDLVTKLIQSAEINQEIETIIERKVAGITETSKAEFQKLKQFLQLELERIEGVANNWSEEKVNLTPQLNKLFREILEQAWKE